MNPTVFSEAELKAAFIAYLNGATAGVSLPDSVLETEWEKFKALLPQAQ